MAAEKKQIGTASYGLKKKNKWNVEDNEKGDAVNIYRILPPFGALAEDGRWAFFDKVHWGYKDSNGWSRNFRCIKEVDFKTKMVKQACPECDLIEKTLKKKDAFIEQQKANGLSDEQAKEAAKPLSEWLKSHNLDKKWYINVKNQKGEVGRLKVAHKHFQALQVVIEDLLKKGIEPIDVNGGVWFNFKRTGRGLQTQHFVYVDTEAITLPDGRKVQGDKPAPLTPDDLAKMQKDAYELNTMFTDLTFEKIKRLVDGNGDQSVVDAVFAAPVTTPAGATVAVATGSDNDEPDEPMEARMPTKVAAPTSAPTPAPVQLAPAPVVVVDDEETQMLARLASIRQKKAEAAAAAGNTNTVNLSQGVIASAANAKTMDDAEFLKNFGGGLK